MGTRRTGSFPLSGRKIRIDSGNRERTPNPVPAYRTGTAGPKSGMQGNPGGKKFLAHAAIQEKRELRPTIRIISVPQVSFSVDGHLSFIRSRYAFGDNPKCFVNERVKSELD